MIKNNELKVIKNDLIAQNIYEMVLSGDDFSDCQIGQFINLKIPECYLRRAFSICKITKNELTIAYKVVGKATKVMTNYRANQLIDSLYPLGSGFMQLNKSKKRIAIIGGGIGVAPLVALANNFNYHAIEYDTYLGFKEKKQAIYLDEFKNLNVVYNQEDYNLGDLLIQNSNYDYIFGCGPKVLLEKLIMIYDDGELLFEEQMGCGFGGCMGCSKRINNGRYKRVCVEGPAFKIKELK